jgi:hypothetical protein
MLLLLLFLACLLLAIFTLAARSIFLYYSSVHSPGRIKKAMTDSNDDSSRMLLTNTKVEKIEQKSM